LRRLSSPPLRRIDAVVSVRKNSTQWAEALCELRSTVSLGLLRSDVEVSMCTLPEEDAAASLAPEPALIAGLQRTSFTFLLPSFTSRIRPEISSSSAAAISA
jgi:hypothetical protein